MSKTPTGRKPLGASKKTDSIDEYVGKRLRALRLGLGMSQTTVATALGVTFQQMQKYEKGKNRVSPSRLVRAAQLFKVNVAAFYPTNETGKRLDDPFLALAQTSQGQRFVRSFNRIAINAVRVALVDLVETIAAVEGVAVQAKGD